MVFRSMHLSQARPLLLELSRLRQIHLVPHSVPESIEEKGAPFCLLCPDLPPCCASWSTKYKLWMIVVTGKDVSISYPSYIYTHTLKRQRLFLQPLNLVWACDLLWPMGWGRSDTMPVLGLRSPCTLPLPFPRKAAFTMGSVYDHCVIKSLEESSAGGWQVTWSRNEPSQLRSLQIGPFQPPQQLSADTWLSPAEPSSDWWPTAR